MMPVHDLTDPSDTNPWSGLHALLVGRDLRAMTSIQDALQRMGLRSTATSSIPEAMADAQHYRPSLLIAEVDLDQIGSAFWLARTLRASYGTSVIFVTEHPDDEAQRLIANNGGGGVLRRPFHRNQVAQSLRLMLDWHALKDRELPQ